MVCDRRFVQVNRTRDMTRDNRRRLVRLLLTKAVMVHERGRRVAKMAEMRVELHRIKMTALKADDHTTHAIDAIKHEKGQVRRSSSNTEPLSTCKERAVGISRNMVKSQLFPVSSSAREQGTWVPWLTRIVISCRKAAPV